jgi:hypothetical protein
MDLGEAVKNEFEQEGGLKSEVNMLANTQPLCSSRVMGKPQD